MEWACPRARAPAHRHRRRGGRGDGRDRVGGLQQPDPGRSHWRRDLEEPVRRRLRGGRRVHVVAPPREPARPARRGARLRLQRDVAERCGPLAYTIGMVVWAGYIVFTGYVFLCLSTWLAGVDGTAPVHAGVRAQHGAGVGADPGAVSGASGRERLHELRHGLPSQRLADLQRGRGYWEGTGHRVRHRVHGSGARGGP